MATTDNPQISLSWATVDEWEAQIEVLRRKIEAAKVILPPRANAALAARIEANKATIQGREEGIDSTDGNFMGSVVQIATSSEGDITKETLRHILRKRGFPEEKLGKTLNVVLYKTKIAGRIHFENGMIGRPR